MRLIDADALLSNGRRGLSIKDATKHSDNIEQRNQAFETMMLYEVRDMIEDAPTVDAVPVVRCKDCRHSTWQHPWPGGQENVLVCDTPATPFSNWSVSPDGFCHFRTKMGD